jgi:hypothetical protein
MTPLPPWMIEELERRRQEHEERERPVLHIVDYPLGRPQTSDEGQAPASGGPIVIEF